MRIAQTRAEDDAVAAMGFRGERQQAARYQHPPRLGQHGREIGDVNHRIGGEDEIRARLGLAAQSVQHVADLEFGIDPGGARLLDHARRQVDAGEVVDIPGEGRRRESRAAAEINGAPEVGGLAHRRAGGQHRLEQQRGAAITEIADQGEFEFRGVLIEQRAHIGLRHVGQRFGS